MAPVPLAPGVGVLSAGYAEGRVEPAARAGLGRLRRLGPEAAVEANAPVEANAERQPQLSGRMNMNPKTFDELLQCNNVNIRFLAQQTSPKGPLRDILVGAFEADWFRAKSCLVFDKWPGGAVPRFTHEFSLMLMTALTVVPRRGPQGRDAAGPEGGACPARRPRPAARGQHRAHRRA